MLFRSPVNSNTSSTEPVERDHGDSGRSNRSHGGGGSGSPPPPGGGDGGGGGDDGDGGGGYGGGYGGGGDGDRSARNYGTGFARGYQLEETLIHTLQNLTSRRSDETLSYLRTEKCYRSLVHRLLLVLGKAFS